MESKIADVIKSTSDKRSLNVFKASLKLHLL